MDGLECEWYKTSPARAVRTKTNRANLKALVWLGTRKSRAGYQVALAECAFFRHNNAQKMPRKGDNSKGCLLRIVVSEQINDALNQIADSGYIGHNRIDVAYRFIQEGVLKALDNPHFQVKQKPVKNR